jgi:4-hydroxybenzoate polyprenyltransferase
MRVQTVKKRSLNEIALGFWQLSHPGPVLIFLAAVVVFALRAAWPNIVWSTIALLLGAHLAMQLSISFINDYRDRKADAENKKDKPISLGWVRPSEALVGGLLSIVIMVGLLLLLPNPLLPLLVSLIYLALGQAYNLGLKSTPLSGIVVALAMPLIPIYGFVGVNRALPFLLWLLPIAFMLGVALNLSNSLPDLEGDAASGAKTLAVVLGVKRSFTACPLLIALSGALIGILTATRLVPAQAWIIVPVLILTFLGLGAMLLFSSPGKPKQTRRSYFYLVALICLVLVGGWFVGVKI